MGVVGSTNFIYSYNSIVWLPLFSYITISIPLESCFPMLFPLLAAEEDGLLAIILLIATFLYVVDLLLGNQAPVAPLLIPRDTYLLHSALLLQRQELYSFKACFSHLPSSLTLTQTQRQPQNSTFLRTNVTYSYLACYYFTFSAVLSCFTPSLLQPLPNSLLTLFFLDSLVLCITCFLDCMRLFSPHMHVYRMLSSSLLFLFCSLSLSSASLPLLSSLGCLA